MSDLRTRLEQIGHRAHPAPDAFERLERTRRRRERNRRVGAGVVALVVAAAGSIVVFTAFRDGEPRIGGTVEEGFFALWPESTYEDALAAQTVVDQDLSGARAWRVDPIATATEFARTALGWGSPDGDGGINVEIPDGVDVAGLGPISFAVYRTAHGLDTMVTDVTLARLVRPHGIWSVVDVRSEAFDLRMVPGQEIAIDGFVAIPTTLGEGTEVAVGVAATGSCSGFHEQTGEVIEGRIVVPVQGVGEGCVGYLYALTRSTSAGQVELGKIMFAYHEPRPALEYTIEAIAAVPVRFVASEDEAPSLSPVPADAVHITCDGPSIALDLPVVRTEPDGVHFIVENTTDHALSLVVLRGGEGPARAVQVVPGETPVALQLPPGPTAFYCADEAGDLAVKTDRVRVEVRDDRNLFVPFDPVCGGTIMRLAPTFAVLPGIELPDAPDPLDLVRDFAEGLQPSDVIERAGYPGAEANPIVRVVRGGQIVAAFDVSQGSDGWAAEPVSCADSGIRIPGERPNPDGWFEWCPEGPFLFPGTGDWSAGASEAAVRFAAAYVAGDEPALAQVLDPSVPAGAEFRVVLAEGAEPTVVGTSPDGAGIDEFSCGNDVAAHTVTVAIDDGSSNVSADFIVYLVLREGGWKVWGVY